MPIPEPVCAVVVAFKKENSMGYLKCSDAERMLSV
jgi:hypothetical protein